MMIPKALKRYMRNNISIMNNSNPISYYFTEESCVFVITNSRTTKIVELSLFSKSKFDF